ncbi:IS630 family transposase [Hyphomicrobiales bacterium BP6-180914]|uniref:IS630 family transposase n=1 Tax=Lichenifustis flavocetrariae TaxID=2949735 RepID=A0AA42CLZ3_9HYPH|nr:IS630 family transposase [Lichenifustis flavocetrariae]
MLQREGRAIHKRGCSNSEQSRPDVMEAREAWFEDQLDFDPDRLVFIDETAAATNMERRYGRAPKGKRCHIAVPHGHYKTTTVTAALRTSGPCAVDLVDGATNGPRFLAYVTGTLVPILKHGDTVILDNLSVHKVSGVRQAIEAAGARLLYLPVYSPDFNPIEQLFAKLKALLRTAAARTVPDLWDAIRQAFTRFTATECRNYLAAAGYDAYDPN